MTCTHKILLIVLLILAGCSSNEIEIVPSPPLGIDLSTSVYCSIDIKNAIPHKTFKVHLFVSGLTQADDLFQFASTAPGVYQITDFGRFVKSFKAFDESHNELTVTAQSTNQWKLADPVNTKRIEYEITDTFHHPQSEHEVPRSIGSLLEGDNVLLNPVAVVGYISNLRGRDYYLDLNLPSDWSVGTSLKSKSGLYFASGFDQLADEPLLMGNLTHTTSLVDNTELNVFAYSKTGKFDSELLSSSFQQVWKDASKFLGGLPVDQYNSLYHFDDNFPGGSNEHSSSAVFTFAENDLQTGKISWLRTSAAHEFFHIITPIHLRSEIVDNFNFAVATPSEHLWWYEGVTVWASVMMQYRNQSIKLKDFFTQFGWHGDINA